MFLRICVFMDKIRGVVVLTDCGACEGTGYCKYDEKRPFTSGNMCRACRGYGTQESSISLSELKSLLHRGDE